MIRTVHGGDDAPSSQITCPPSFWHLLFLPLSPSLRFPSSSSPSLLLSPSSPFFSSYPILSHHPDLNHNLTVHLQQSGKLSLFLQSRALFICLYILPRLLL